MCGPCSPPRPLLPVFWWWVRETEQERSHSPTRLLSFSFSPPLLPSSSHLLSFPAAYFLHHKLLQNRRAYFAAIARGRASDPFGRSAEGPLDSSLAPPGRAFIGRYVTLSRGRAVQTSLHPFTGLARLNWSEGLVSAGLGGCGGLEPAGEAPSPIACPPPSPPGVFSALEAKESVVAAAAPSPVPARDGGAPLRKGLTGRIGASITTALLPNALRGRAKACSRFWLLLSASLLEYLASLME